MTQKQYDSYTTYRDWLTNKIYKEKPVDIITFISDPKYLGSSFDGGKTLFGCWKPVLKDIFYNDEKYLVVLTGSTGTGKTLVGYVCVAYCMYRALLAKDLWSIYGLSSGGRFAIAFFNLTKTLSASKGFNVLQSMLLKSSWFKEHGVLKGEGNNQRLEFSLFDYVLASPTSQGYGTTGHHVLCALLDEIDSPNASILTKQKVINAFDTTLLRFKGRFVKHNKSMGRFFLVSSKQDEMSFLNMYINKMKDTNQLYVADFKKWEAFPQDNFCGLRFKVSCGDGFNLPQILSRVVEHRECTIPLERYEIKDKELDIKEAKEKGFEILDVPVEYYEDFSLDISKSLRDLGGISVAGMRKSKLFPSEDNLKECYDMSRENPVKIPLITLGLKDTVRLIDFLDISKFVVNRSIPRYLHCDIAYSGEGDNLGLSMSCVYGNKTVERFDERSGTTKKFKFPIVHTDFVMCVRARPGDVIPFHKIEEFIITLRDMGFRIAEFTSDLKLASQGLIQALKLKGITADNFSMDKPVDNYISFRNLVFEKRWNCFYHPLMHLEAKELIYDQNLQKVDHPMYFEDLQELKDGDVKSVVINGSKDLIDSCSGSVIRALQASGVAMDTDLMQSLLSTLDPIGDIERDKERTLEGILPNVLNKDGKPVKVIGTANSDGIQKFSEILKSLQ